MAFMGLQWIFHFVSSMAIWRDSNYRLWLWIILQQTLLGGGSDQPEVFFFGLLLHTICMCHKKRIFPINSNRPCPMRYVSSCIQSQDHLSDGFYYRPSSHFTASYTLRIFKTIIKQFRALELSQRFLIFSRAASEMSRYYIMVLFYLLGSTGNEKKNIFFIFSMG